jgi:hypothetical protein
MTPDELRALADALWVAMSFHAPDSDARNALLLASVYLRAQADAQPVAAVPVIQERGPWLAGRDKQQAWKQQVWIESDDFTHDVRLDVTGDFESDGHKFAYAQEIARRLNAAPAAPQAEQPIDLDAVAMQQMRQAAAESTWMPSEYTSNDWIADVCRWLRDGPPAAAPPAEPDDPHMIVAEDRFPDVPAERWKPCPQCGEDFDRECPICDGLGRVLATDGEQAEPKREPLTYEQLVSACYTYRHDFGLLDPDEQELVIEEAGRWAKAFGIGGSDE